VLIVAWTTACSDIYSRVIKERKAADAQQVLRDFRAAEATFASQAKKFGTLPELVQAGLMRTDLIDSLRAHYAFKVTVAQTSYQVSAVPVHREDGKAYVDWSFFLDQSGVLRGRAFGKANGYTPAGKEDAPLMKEQQ